MSTRAVFGARTAAACAVVACIVLFGSVAGAQYCGAPGVTAPQCDGQCPYGQMCADGGGTCQCVPANFGCTNVANPNGPPVCWGACPSATQVCATFAGGCMCVQGPNLCNNGIPDPGEGCEDGNTVDGDGCDSNCTPTACGNGIATAGEECDGLDDGACLAGCQPDCTCTPTPPTNAQIGCFVGLGKAGIKLVKGRLKILQPCREKELSGGTCAFPNVALDRLDDKIAGLIAKRCSLSPAALHNMGFPGRCPDANALDGFTTADLTDCIISSHGNIIDGLVFLTEYDPTLVPPIDPSSADCQSALGRAGALVLSTVEKSVVKCRINILKGKLSLAPETCATADPATAAAITKATDKATTMIQAACDDATIAALKACTPDQTSTPAAATCIADAHRNAADNPISADPADLIDYEYATQPVCGDHVINQPAEECDGPADTLCPGLCQPDCTCP